MPCSSPSVSASSSVSPGRHSGWSRTTRRAAIRDRSQHRATAADLTRVTLGRSGAAALSQWKAQRRDPFSFPDEPEQDVLGSDVAWSSCNASRRESSSTLAALSISPVRGEQPTPLARWAARFAPCGPLLRDPGRASSTPSAEPARSPSGRWSVPGRAEPGQSRVSVDDLPRAVGHDGPDSSRSQSRHAAH